MGSKLANKQESFINEYLIDLNATQAAIRAGYSAKTAGITGSKLLKKANIRTRIDERLKEMESRKIADATEVMEYLTAVIRGEKKEETISTLDGSIVEKTIGGREQVKAAELLAKRYGLLTDNVKMSGNVPVQIIDDLGAE